MKKLKLIIAVAAVMGIGVAYFMLTPKGEINIHKAQEEARVTAVELFSDFMKDESVGNEKYSGKVISVNGKLSKVDKNEAGSYTLWLETGVDDGLVLCNMSNLDSTALKGLAIGQPLNVKGVCTGYLFDVVIDKAIINNTKN